MNRFFIIFLMTLAIISLLNNNCFSQENESEGFTKLVLLQGKVVDKNGHGIPLVMIFVYGTTLGGISQQDGSFKLQVPEDHPNNHGLEYRPFQHINDPATTCVVIAALAEPNDEFWEQAAYCGYLRRTFSRSDLVSDGDLFINEAYARIVGLCRDDMMQR
jgi:hypothetical protein